MRQFVRQLNLHEVSDKNVAAPNNAPHCLLASARAPDPEAARRDRDRAAFRAHTARPRPPTPPPRPPTSPPVAPPLCACSVGVSSWPALGGAVPERPADGGEGRERAVRHPGEDGGGGGRRRQADRRRRGRDQVSDPRRRPGSRHLHKRLQRWRAPGRRRPPAAALGVDRAALRARALGPARPTPRPRAPARRDPLPTPSPPLPPQAAST